MRTLRPPKLFIALIIALVVGFLMWQYPIGKNLPILINWISTKGISGYIVYIIAFTLGTVLFIPGSIFTMGAGFAWGITAGSILASISLTLSAVIAFVIGRYIARDWVEDKIKNNEGLKRLDVMVAKGGFKIVLLTRLSPAFPYTSLNYVYGSTGVKISSYIFATWLGMIPGTVMYVYFGSIITEISKIAIGQTPAAAGKNLYYALGLIITVGVTLLIAKIARNALSDKN